MFRYPQTVKQQGRWGRGIDHGRRTNLFARHTRHGFQLVEVDFQDISTFFGTQIPIALEASNKAGATMKGLPTGLFWQYDTVAMKTDMAVAIPLEKPMKSIPELELLNLGGKALVVDFLGNFALTAEAHAALDDYMADKKLQSIPPVLEEYVTDPSLEPDTAKWLTRVIYFVTAKVDSTAMEQ
jgi:effector-binding domain-containing protein